MTLFPVWLLEILVHGGLIACGVGAVALLGMLLWDIKKGSMW